jgi:hypothetical protein
MAGASSAASSSASCVGSGLGSPLKSCGELGVGSVSSGVGDRVSVSADVRLGLGYAGSQSIRLTGVKCVSTLNDISILEHLPTALEFNVIP